MKIDKSVAIVTGAAGGIGTAICKALQSRGARIVAVGRSSTSLDSLKTQLPEVRIMPADVRDKEAVNRIAADVQAELGSIDILVNNAAIGLFQSIAESTSEDIEKVYSTNLFGPVYFMQAVIPIMRMQKRGHIVNVSSIIGHHSVHNQGIYASSKAALDRVSESVYAEEKENGINVSVIVPDRTATDFLKNVTGPKEKAVLPGGSNLRQLTPEDVAEGLVKAIENGELLHYSSLKGRIFALLSRTAPGVIRHMLRPNKT